MTLLEAPPLSRNPVVTGEALAVSYLRVSTKEQAEKGGKEEGFSIPAQRDANLHKANQLGAVVVEEFVDAGESAKKADRPALQRMIRYVKQHKVAYCIVHKVDRLARNRADDVAIHFALQEAGVMLVSATENIDETPSGMLLHGIMSTIAEFYSRNLATEVVKGMTQKAMTGGTPSKAPVGYLNTLERDELGREVRSIALDADRAPLVKWAFEAYASGNYSLAGLRTELVKRGLTTSPTPRRPSRSIALSSVHRMLQNPYYKGDVVYRGVRYDGAHDRLVEPEVWYQVQSVLSAHNSSGDRTQKHDHYLKGSVYCRECGSRLMINNTKARNGAIYPYFVCLGRHQKRTDCTQAAILVSDVEDLIVDYYERIQISPVTKDALRGMLHHELDRLTASSSTEAADLTRRRTQIIDEQDRLLEAHLKEALSLEQFAKFQDKLRAELTAVDERLAEHHNDYAEARNHIDDCLNLAADIGRIYAGCSDQNRRLANQAFFTRIRIGEHKQIDAVTAKPFNVVLDPDVQQEASELADRVAGPEGKNETPARSNVPEFRTSNIWCPRLESNQRPLVPETNAL
ncbi:MAG TPA: recombinase family protein, partial [Actinomycetota bacterium]|nr:recombinase family protein [Actinomycetota bacterium]